MSCFELAKGVWCRRTKVITLLTWMADSNMARDAFATFIPLSVESDARTKIIFDFFDLMAAIAAHGKTNGMGGRKLSRLAGWWAFDQSDEKNGFDGGYKSWSRYLQSFYATLTQVDWQVEPPMLQVTFSSLTFAPFRQTPSEVSAAYQHYLVPYRPSYKRPDIHQNTRPTKLLQR